MRALKKENKELKALLGNTAARMDA